MAFVSHRMSRTEQWGGRLTQSVSLMGWCLLKLRRYTTFAALIWVVLPEVADVLTVLDAGANMRLRACVVDV